jgi:beta-glucosidase
MIRIGLFDHPVNGLGAANVSTPAHRALAEQIAEQGSVLLKNSGVLPLGPRVRSLAVIGAAAGDAAQFGEGGSGSVNPSETITPVQGITTRAGSSVRVTYAAGTLGTAPLPVLTGSALRSPSGAAGFQGTYYSTTDWTGTPVATRTDASIDFTAAPVTSLPPAWSGRWVGTLTPPTSGDYRFSLTGNGGFRLWVNGHLIADNKYANLPITRLPEPIHLTAGKPVSIRVEYTTAGGFGTDLHLGWQPPDLTLRDQAVAAARAADVAVVFVNDVTGEGSDRSSLALPGDQNQLIEAVARANPRTVVVLNTGGPVLAPWLSHVPGVFEVWYPGQEYGTAIARLLYGDVNPSGKLPMTWPANEQQGPASQYSDLHLVNERYSEGVDVGYRWYDATGQRPLFPFGHGLSYSTFRYSNLRVTPAGRATFTVTARVTNTGAHAGADVAQLYLGAPATAHEPPKQLKGYDKVDLRPGQSTIVRFRITAQDLASWRGGRWTVVPGTYTVMVGNSSRSLPLTGRLDTR